eukprot:2020546-Lingulodinium_polyedra.AAC.1
MDPVPNRTGADVIDALTQLFDLEKTRRTLTTQNRNNSCTDLARGVWGPSRVCEQRHPINPGSPHARKRH